VAECDVGEESKEDAKNVGGDLMELKAKEYKKFEDIKRTREDGSEYWSARELANALDYTQWRNFQKVINRAMIACETSGHRVLDDFAEVGKIVEAGATNKTIKDYELSRYDGGANRAQLNSYFSNSRRFFFGCFVIIKA